MAVYDAAQLGCPIPHNSDAGTDWAPSPRLSFARKGEARHHDSCSAAVIGNLSGGRPRERGFRRILTPAIQRCRLATSSLRQVAEPPVLGNAVATGPMLRFVVRFADREFSGRVRSPSVDRWG